MVFMFSHSPSQSSVTELNPTTATAVLCAYSYSGRHTRLEDAKFASEKSQKSQKSQQIPQTNEATGYKNNKNLKLFSET